MPINPIKEQRKLAQKYVIGYYSEDEAFGNELRQSLQNSSTNFELINLYGLDEDALKLYLSTVDEAIFDSRIPENIESILKNSKLFIRIVDINDLLKVSYSVDERSSLVISLKQEKNYGHEKDLKFIMQIASILENKDPYTKDHSARVAKYALAIGEEYFSNQSESFTHEAMIHQLNLIMLAAWAHDIGKNSIAQNLLDKNSKLTESEYDLIKMHADFGAEMIRKLLGNEELAEVIENHHERIDGFGYHDLTEFSDTAKIIAIADSFDAMTTTRPYTTKLEDVNAKSKLKTVEEAINELQVSSHQHFDLDENRMSQQLDTNLTDIFVRLLKRDLSLIQEGKTDEVTLLSGGIDEKGFLKAGFWDDKTQEYTTDQSVSKNQPNLLK